MALPVGMTLVALVSLGVFAKVELSGTFTNATTSDQQSVPTLQAIATGKGLPW